MAGNRGTGACAFALFLALAIDPAICAPVRIAQASAAEIEFWRSVESTKDPAELKAYLQAYPDGQFAPLAKLRLEKLQGPAQDKAISAAPEATPRTKSSSNSIHIPTPPPVPQRGWIGVQIQDISEARARELGLTDRHGVEIVSLVSYGPGSAGGLRPGDIVLAIGGETLIGGMQHMIRLTGALAPGASADVSILRHGQRHTFKVTAGNLFNDHWNAAHRGNIHAMISLGSTFAGGTLVAQDHRVANDWFRKAADAGSPAAMNTLGDRYRFGQGFERDDREAIRWYRKAAEAGSADSMFSLGLAYYRGQGVERDFSEAARWYQRAIEKSHAGATHNYALLLHNGEGLTKDEATAITYFRKAAVLNQPEAFFMLGDAYLNGRGVAKNFHEAARWFREATKRGVGHGYTGLGLLFERGEGGLPKSTAEAIKHYRKGAEAGHDIALERLRALKASTHDPQEMQTLLADLGFDPGPADGRPGAKTIQAIREFQKSRGLKVDGAASLALIGQLRDALKQKTAASATSSPPAAVAGGAKSLDLGPLKGLEKLDSLE